MDVLADARPTTALITTEHDQDENSEANLHQLAKTLRNLEAAEDEAELRWLKLEQKHLEGWRERMLQRCLTMFEARQHFGRNDRGFGQWLDAVGIKCGENNSAALVRMGAEPEVTKAVLKLVDKKLEPDTIFRKFKARYSGKFPEVPPGPDPKAAITPAEAEEKAFKFVLASFQPTLNALACLAQEERWVKVLGRDPLCVNEIIDKLQMELDQRRVEEPQLRPRG